MEPAWKLTAGPSKEITSILRCQRLASKLPKCTWLEGVNAVVAEKVAEQGISDWKSNPNASGIVELCM